MTIDGHARVRAARPDERDQLEAVEQRHVDVGEDEE